MERGVGASSPIPTFPQTNGLAGFVECVGLLDVLAQLGEAAGRKINFNDRKLRVVESRAQRAESIRKQHRAFRASQRLHCGPAGKRFSVGIVVAPANFEIPETRVIAIGWPGPSRDVRSLYRQACMKRAVIDHVNSPRGLTGPRRIERFGWSGAGTGAEKDCGDEHDLLDRSRNFPDQPGPILHPDHSSDALRFQRSDDAGRARLRRAVGLSPILWGNSPNLVGSTESRPTGREISYYFFCRKNYKKSLAPVPHSMDRGHFLCENLFS